MDSPFYDAPGDSDWEGSGELEWTERDWKQFLKESDQEVLRFLAFYTQLRKDANRLDRAAQEMGWESDEWSSDKMIGEEELSGAFDASDDDDDEDDDYDGPGSDDEPLTVHKHPLFVSSTALLNLIGFYWGILLQEDPPCVNGLHSYDFCNHVRQAEVNAIIGIHALEMGDYSLVVCHLQRAMTSLNDAFGLFQKVVGFKGCKIEKSFKEEFANVVFDMREVWLRVLKECRGVSGVS